MLRLASIAALVIAGFGPAIASAANHAALDAEAWRRVERGETVVRERAVADYPWPEVVAYRRTSAPPLAVMAVYADFGGQAEWAPGLVTSRIVGREAVGVSRVFYEYDVTGPNEQYEVTITVSREADAWKARWTLVTARYARRLEGALTVLPHGGGSLLVYSTRVDPGALGVALGTPASVATRLRRTSEALTARTERLAATASETLAKLTDALRELSDGPVVRR